MIDTKPIDEPLLFAVTAKLGVFSEAAKTGQVTPDRYTFVSGNAIKYSKERIKKQLNELWGYAKRRIVTEHVLNYLAINCLHH